MDRFQTTVLLVSCLGLVASPAAAERSWSVQPGDTLGALAHRFDVSQADLRTWNNLEGDLLRIGQVLRLAPPNAGGDEAAPREAAETGPTPAPEPNAVPRITTTAADGPVYAIAPGDTLSGIAERLNVKQDELLAWNPGLDADRIRAGQVLRLGDEGRRVQYHVRRGDTLTGIARRYRVEQAKLLRWNPGLSPDRLRPGQTLTVFTKIPASRSESIGTPSDGELKHARRLMPHRGYRIRDLDRAWGTDEVVHALRTAFDRVVATFPRAPKVEVHDVSYKDGGPIAHHRSHQSGRDVDIAYFQKDCRNKGCAFDRIRGHEMDVPRQWALLSHWLKRDQLEAVFIDYALQPALYRYAKQRGASEEQLKRWFQYPRGRTFPLGVIRHFPKHADHMHVRFACHKTDKDCKTFRPFLLGARHATR